MRVFPRRLKCQVVVLGIVHRMSTVSPSCRQNVHMSTGCPQDAHKLCTGCPQNVSKLSTGCPQIVHWMSISCPQDVRKLSAGCPQVVHRMPTRCPQDAHKMSTESPQVPELLLQVAPAYQERYPQVSTTLVMSFFKFPMRVEK